MNTKSLQYTCLVAVLISCLIAFFISCNDPVAESKGDEHAFAAEVSKMMDIIIHSLYKNKDIFIREVIANASDALDKLRQLSLTDKSLAPPDWQYNITLKADPENRSLTIQDTGIGMTKEELITNLGTIAHSGTKEFIEKFKDQSSTAATQIGQFGVGFYSIFLAGNHVEVISKTSSGKKHIWECDISKGKFTIRECPDSHDVEDPVGQQGTKIVIKLNDVSDDNEDFCNQETLKNVVHRYSDYINFPIYLYTRTTETVEVPIEEDVDANKEEPVKSTDGSEPESEKKIKVEDVPEDETSEEKKDDKPKTKKVTTESAEYVVINNSKPLWTRDPHSITDEEYVEFYKGVSKDTKAPLDWTHFKVEASTDFRGLIYIPSKPHFQLLSNDSPTDFLKLYVKRVFISSDFPDFPRYMSFIRAVVDAEDMPLNVSRETLQRTKVVKDIKNRVISKTLTLLNKMAKNETLYADFYNTYSNHLKLGVISESEDDSRKNDLAGLLRFQSSFTSGKKNSLTSLDDYITRMKPNQTDIYFVSGTDVPSLRSLPYVGSLLAKDLEVIFMTDTYDEYTVQALPLYKQKTLKNVAKGGIQFTDGDADAEKKRVEEQTATFKPLFDYLMKLFPKRIEKVVISNLLTESPMAVVANMFGWSPAMERLMKANSGKDDPMSGFFGRQKKILEINANHPLMIGLLARVTADASAASADKELEKDVKLLYDAALLHSGYELKNPAAFATRVEDILRSKYNVEPLAAETVKAAEEADNQADGPDSPFGGFGGMGDDFKMPDLSDPIPGFDNPDELKDRDLTEEDYKRYRAAVEKEEQEASHSDSKESPADASDKEDASKSQEKDEL